MIVFEHVTSGDPHANAGAAASQMSQAIAEYADAFIARISAGAASAVNKRAPNPVEQKFQAAERALEDIQAVVANASTPEQREAVSRVLVPMAKDAVKTYREADAVVQELLVEFETWNRSQRRPREEAIRRLAAAAGAFESLTVRLIELVDRLDPTPEDHLEQEMRRIHGGQAESMMASFKELACSDRFTLPAFKQRHHLQ